MTDDSNGNAAPHSAACPTCGKHLPANAPSGICPTCLFQAGMNFHEDPTVTPASNHSFVPPKVSDLSAHFSQLEIQQLIGCGGMGAVYKARQTKLNRTVALKVLRPETGNDAAFAQRFNREAQTLARLSHPNIVGIHDFGEVATTDENGQSKTLYYFVMEYVDGSDLRQLMDNRMSVSDAMNVISQVCDALQFAHEEGIVHRDIKPENILIDSRGQVKIADFGLAKLASKTDQHFTLTGTHQVMGTPRYMAPEQMEGSRTVDHRADVYSLGVVFYEMLTGEVPMGQFEPPSKKTQDVSSKLDNVVLQSMAREPERRFQSANDMRNEMYVATDGVFPVYDNGAIPGPSTILDMGVQRAFAGIKREFVGHKKTSWVPGVLAIVLSVVGLFGITFLLLWTTPKQGNWYLSAYDNMLLIAGAVLLVQVLVLFIFGSSQRRLWRSLLILCSGVIVLMLIAGFSFLHSSWHEMESTSKQYQTISMAFYSAVAGLALTILGAWDLRKYLDHRSQQPRSKKKLPETAHVGFVVPQGRSAKPHIASHFQMLGYQIVDSSGDEWTFERGSKSGHMGIDLRKCFTVLTIRTGTRPDGSEWVSCGWAIPGAFVSCGEITKLENEGQGLARAIGVDSVSLSKPGESKSIQSQTVLSLLGSTSRKGKWKPPSTMYVISILGGCEVDFRDADLQPGVTTISALGFLGGVELIVPPNVDVEVNGIGLLGSFDQDMTKSAEANAPATTTLRVTGLSLLAGVSVITK